MPGPTFILELPICVNDSESRTILRKLEFARQLHNATLGSALGQLQQLRQDKDWKKACSMPKGKERTNLLLAKAIKTRDGDAIIFDMMDDIGFSATDALSDREGNCY